MKLPNHERPLDRNHCDLCRWYHDNERFRQLVDMVDLAEPAGALVDVAEPAGALVAWPPCVHEGATVRKLEVVTRGLSPQRDWFYCLSGYGRAGAIVCKCDECNPKCPGYRVDRDRAEQ